MCWPIPWTKVTHGLTTIPHRSYAIILATLACMHTRMHVASRKHVDTQVIMRQGNYYHQRLLGQDFLPLYLPCCLPQLGLLPPCLPAQKRMCAGSMQRKHCQQTLAPKAHLLCLGLVLRSLGACAGTEVHNKQDKYGKGSRTPLSFDTNDASYLS